MQIPDRTLRLGVMVTLSVCLTLLMVGFRSPSHHSTFTFNEYLTQHAPQSSAWDQANFVKFGKNPVDEARLQLTLRLSPTEGTNDLVTVSGQGQILVSRTSYPLRLDDSSLLAVRTIDDGHTLYFGDLCGEAKVRNGTEQMCISTVFIPETRQRMLNVSVGTIGSEAFLAFGDPFITSDIAHLMGLTLDER